MEHRRNRSQTGNTPILSTALCLSLLAGCAAASQVEKGDSYKAGAALIGRKVPALELPLTDGSRRALSDYKGRVLYMEVGASW